MQLKDLEGMVALFNQHQLTYLEVTEGDMHVCLKKEITYSQAPTVGMAPVYVAPSVGEEQSQVGSEAVSVTSTGTSVKAPMVGVFYTAKSPEDAPFVSVGSKVQKGDVIGLIEAMKMMNEITAPVSGVITSVVAENEGLVSFDDTLYTIEESAYVS